MLKDGERGEAARRREMRLSSLHVRGINDERRRQSRTNINEEAYVERRENLQPHKLAQLHCQLHITPRFAKVFFIHLLFLYVIFQTN